MSFRHYRQTDPPHSQAVSSGYFCLTKQSGRRLSDCFPEKVFCKNNNGNLILKENSEDYKKACKITNLFILFKLINSKPRPEDVPLNQFLQQISMFRALSRLVDLPQVPDPGVVHKPVLSFGYIA